MKINHLNAIRFSLAFLWIFTAVTSLYFDPATGLTTLAQANIAGQTANLLLYAGSMLDWIIGFWLLSNKKQKLCCEIQLTTIIIFTLLLTLIDYSYWLHPFGALTKNIPIIILIVIYRSEFISNQ